MRIKKFSVVLVFVLVVCLGACGKSVDVVENTVEPDTTVEESEEVSVETEADPEVETEEPKEEIPVIYADNEHINLYLDRYNEVNVDAPIEREDFEVYYHHGQEHKDQILLNESVVVSAQTGDKVKIVIEGGNTEDDYKKAFMLYAGGYDTGLNNEVLENYWEQVVNNSSRFTQFEEFEVEISRFSDAIEYMCISGEVE